MDSDWNLQRCAVLRQIARKQWKCFVNEHFSHNPFTHPYFRIRQQYQECLVYRGYVPTEKLI